MPQAIFVELADVRRHVGCVNGSQNATVFKNLPAIIITF